MTLNQTFIQCGAPSLCGIKPGNMFSIRQKLYSKEGIENWRKIFRNQGISLQVIKTDEGTTLFFAYNLKWIEQILSDTFIKSYLHGKKYPVKKGTQAILKEFFARLKTRQDFPHEAGIFLGYPFEDVISFEKNEGKNCKYCGYWKSYTNPEEAKICCNRYVNCCRMCKQWFDEGFSVSQIIEQYKQATEGVA